MSRRSPIEAAASSGRRAKKRFDAAVEVCAWYGGWIGLAALAGVGFLWYSPNHGGFERDTLVRALVFSLMLASLVGWGFVNEGQNMLARRLGQGVAFIAFFALPLGCAIAGLLETQIENATGFGSPDHPFWFFVRWYPAAAVLLCAAAFLKRSLLPRTRIHAGRALWHCLLLVPYALLFAYLVLHLHIELLDDPLHETLGAAGRYAIIVQLLLMYFVGNPAG